MGLKYPTVAAGQKAVVTVVQEFLSEITNILEEEKLQVCAFTEP